jgi:hypothetical protein
MLVSAALSEDAVEERVHHHVARVDPELREEALETMTGFADEDAARDCLVLRRILADDEHTRAAVESSSVEDGAPLDTKIARRIGGRARLVLAEVAKRLTAVTRIEALHAAGTPLA